MGQLTGLVGSIEYGLAEDRLDETGDLWEPEEEDPTAQRECTSPFHLAPYMGKYDVDYANDMDGVRMQARLAGVVAAPAEPPPPPPSSPPFAGSISP
ncbi:hypothetical protein MNEG_13107 [Monoraphidium neglectum]|uniref:Uncharacterized protein n=1 Tax=Monoraphidium neglectum TaxID=145388 RepID=A0A0D2MIM3_9CHLO|nr:hypothetical protein MNEG_13107 [Monoraphidium neglectum]KIY94855.1 hypothetical protein MNEG_13107 [Monoraphidium neglectum]|eukprot:XP_013893875.1 hypothetical protein MNEG_13107 [Monoraphidium neglectum]